MELIAAIDDPAVIHRILAHLGLPGARDGPELGAGIATEFAVRQPGRVAGLIP